MLFYAQVDLIVSHVIKISDRTLALAELPEQLATALQQVHSAVAGVRRTVLAVSKAENPSTFVLVPEMSLKEKMSVARGDSLARSRLGQWVSAIKEAVTSPQPLQSIALKLSRQRFHLHLVCERCCK